MSEPRRSSRVASRGATTTPVASAAAAAPPKSGNKASTPATSKKTSTPTTKPTATKKRPSSSIANNDDNNAEPPNPSSLPATKKTKPPPSGALPLGSPLPSLSLQTTSPSTTPLDPSKLRSTVLFTYPRANTSGCTTQAKCYRDAYAEFEAKGYQVYGLSNDGVPALKSWREKQKFQYDLISDPKRELIKALTGCEDKTRRSHFVIDAEGKLALAKLSVKPPESHSDALAFIEKSTK